MQWLMKADLIPLWGKAKHELRVKICELRVQTHELRVPMHELRVQILELGD